MEKINNIVQDPEYWNDGDTFTYTDNNIGEYVEPSFLNISNNRVESKVFNTITKKDNVLFLGNYSIKHVGHISIENLFNNIGETKNFSIVSEDKYIYNYIKDSGDSTYTPNMALSYDDICCFKRGETYLLGLVFKFNDGTNSSVLYVGEYSPTSDPIVNYNSPNAYLKKKIPTTKLSSELCSKLYDNNIVGVFPVIARTSEQENVICQGYLGKTLTYNHTNIVSPTWRQYNKDDITTAGFQGVLLDIPHTYYNTEGNYHVSPNYEIYALNTPEMEFGSNPIPIKVSPSTVVLDLLSYTTPYPKRKMKVSFNSFYPLSKEDIVNHVWRWHGYTDFGHVDPNSSDFTNTTNKPEYYRKFPILVWQRDKLGAEAPNTKILSKKVFSLISAGGVSAAPLEKNLPIQEIDSYTGDTATIIKLGDIKYQGNLDTLLTFSGSGKSDDYIEKELTVYLREVHKITKQEITKINNPNTVPDKDEDLVNVPEILFNTKITNKAHFTFVNYYRLSTAGFDYINDVDRTYWDNLAWPHSYNSEYAGYDRWGRCVDPIKISYKSPPHLVLKLSNPVNYYGIAELRYKNNNFRNTESVRRDATWVKCGEARRIYSDNIITVRWERGDWFYGKFESLRLMPFNRDSYQDITEVVQGFLMSKHNLNARVDINRGNSNPYIDLTNFNETNTVYDQDDNFFTYSVIPTDNISFSRDFKNTIQWTNPKVYGSITDSWASIPSTNTLDLDGDKGELVALRRFNNNIIAFQESGVSQILYNESVQVATENSVPIEIANSNKVQGKRYLWENKGCQNRSAITISQSGLYFIDGINRTAFLIGDGNIIDIFASSNMKSWALKNLNSDWWCYYDIFSQEVLFTNEEQCLAFDDITKKFQCFLSYENVKYPLTLNGRTYLLQEKNSKMDWNINNIWKKNESPFSNIKGYYVPLEIGLQINPEPTKDKIFSTLEYRADSFTGIMLDYNENGTFDTLQVDNEYQDTGEVTLNNIICTPSNLKKKFRIWRVQIPRDKKNKVDRIRNPWCNIKLKALGEDVGRFVIHDMKISYLS